MSSHSVAIRPALELQRAGVNGISVGDVVALELHQGWNQLEGAVRGVVGELQYTSAVDALWVGPPRAATTNMIATTSLTFEA